MTVTRKHLLIVIAVLLLFVLFGCAPAVTAGTVTAKQYVAEEIDFDKICTQYNGTKCVTYTQIPDHEPECFELSLAAPDGRTGEVCVPDETWNSTEIGGQYP